ncbi:hypothetical protein QR680_011441 [Steinernema hermaphroditum]|uniref:Proton-coupled zinc antiporter SLC30A9, mitochondrial n=1 Tax=Steinernema hermaphroditum TaxID=289476 RepID=A0AA39I0Y7_9BILA|nr:hypothetical protein QR680_011441 [Steinernema hermaphroditum]
MNSVVLLRELTSQLRLSSRQSLVFFSSSTSDDPPSKFKKRLFKVAQFHQKRTRTYDDSKIDERRAMAEFNLSEDHLKDLPREAHMPNTQVHKLYAVSDVYNRAVKVHGSQQAVQAKGRVLLGTLSESEKMRLRLRAEAANGAPGVAKTKGADFVVGIAFALNTCDTICKFAAAYVTGSKSLFAEGVHSTMDTVNQLILLLGIKYSKKHPDPNFPYGYGNMRYVTSLISGCGILSFGCGLSLYHGISGLLHPAALEPLTYAYYALFMSLCFQGASAMTAFREVRSKAANAKMSVLNYVQTSADPSLNVVLLEDSAAVTGVAVALTAVSLSSLLNSPIPDCIGSIVIGCLLGTVAAFIIRSNAAHLVGRSLPKRIVDDITCRLSNDSVIRSVHDVKATALGVEQSRFKAELDFDGREITRKYLREQCDLPVMLQQVHNVKTTGQMEMFMIDHGEKIIDRIGDEVDRLESDITKKHPDIRHVDLEAL